MENNRGLGETGNSSSVEGTPFCKTASLPPRSPWVGIPGWAVLASSCGSSSAVRPELQTPGFPTFSSQRCEGPAWSVAAVPLPMKPGSMALSLVPELLPPPARHCSHMVSVFLSHSKAQAIIHCKPTSGYPHRVVCTGFINFLRLGNGLARIEEAGDTELQVAPACCKLSVSISRVSCVCHS